MKKLNQDKALVLFSGGQDSSIVLAWALDRYASVETIGFDYGQRHAVELGARQAVRRELRRVFPAWSEKLHADHIVDLAGVARLTSSALTSEADIVIDERGLPTSFVPGRNLAFMVLAGARAYQSDAGVLVGGMCEADSSGYPDCRRDALEAQTSALRLGLDADIGFEAPLMSLTKAESWSLAEALGGQDLLDLILEHSHTCYIGDRSRRHDWGYGCGVCPACELRAKGWRDFVASRAA